MPEPSKTSIAARLAILYITVGALMDVWTAIYYAFYLHNQTIESDTRPFWCAGFFFTGLTLLIIGFTLGRIGRAARHADMPPDPLKLPAPTAQPAATAVPAGVVPVVPAAGVGAPAVPVAPARR